MKRVIALMLCLMFAALPAVADTAAYEAATPIYFASEAQLTNILRAADRLNGCYVPDGEYFSFNDVLGPRTAEYGYVSAKNGRGVEKVGGGVSQVATTLYLALLQVSGIRYSNITTYGKQFSAGYVSDGALAVVTDYAAAVDFAFVNGSGSDLTIMLWQDGEELHCAVETQRASAAAGPQGVLVGRASFPICADPGVVNNISRAVESASGTYVEAGGEFSFNAVVGPRTEKYGYVTAINGRGVNNMGGGVAQVASVIWLAVKDMDCITVTDKATYGKRYNQDYVASSEDAIVTDYKAGTDFAFRNDGPSSITLYLYVEDSILCCELYEDSEAGWIFEPVKPGGR